MIVTTVPLLVVHVVAARASEAEKIDVTAVKAPTKSWSADDSWEDPSTSRGEARPCRRLDEHAHLAHQERREGQPHRERRELASIVDQQFVGDAEGSKHGGERAAACAPRVRRESSVTGRHGRDGMACIGLSRDDDARPNASVRRSRGNTPRGRRSVRAVTDRGLGSLTCDGLRSPPNAARDLSRATPTRLPARRRGSASTLDPSDTACAP